MARQPFATRADIEGMQEISNKREALFSKTIYPFLKENDRTLLDNTDLYFLYRSAGLRMQIFSQIAVKQLSDGMRTRGERVTGKKAQSDPLLARLSAQEAVMRRNEGLISVARDRDLTGGRNLMEFLDEMSPKLARRVRDYHDENHMLPQFIGADIEHIKAVVYAPYRKFGMEIDRLTEQRLKNRVNVFQRANDVAARNSNILWRRLDSMYVPRYAPNARPGGEEPK